MRNKIFYILIGALLTTTAGVVLFTHQAPVIAEVTQQVPDFSSRTPYLALTYDQCPPNVSVPEEYTCIYNLAYSTLDEADTLANKLMHASASTDGEQMDGFYDSLHKSVESAQKARDTYFDAVCDADSMLIYGGSGILSEQRACMYYYAGQYLNTLKGLQRSLAH
jgi:hypothetical protein